MPELDEVEADCRSDGRLFLTGTQTHLRQPRSDAEVAQPVDGVHHPSAPPPGVQIGGKHTHAVAVAFHLAGPSAAGISPEPPLRR